MATSIDATVAVFAADVDKAHRIINGPATGALSIVTTDGGPVRTLARVGADAAVAVQSAVDNFLLDQVLVDGPSVAWNFANGNTARVTLGPLGTGVKRTILSPTGLKRTSGYFIVDQDSVGGRKIDAWGPVFRFAAGIPPVLSVVPGKRDVFLYVCDAQNVYIANQIIGAAVVGGGTSLAPPAAPPAAPAPPGPATIQSEVAELVGALTVQSAAFPGFQGTGYVGNFATAGDSLTFRFPNVVDGQYNIAVRYARDATTSNNPVSINGAAATVSAFLPIAGSAWGVLTLTNIPLNAGTNLVTIGRGDGGLVIDSCTLTWNNGTPITPSAPGSAPPPPPPPPPAPPPEPVPPTAAGAGTTVQSIQAEAATRAGGLFVETVATANGYTWAGNEGTGWVSWFTDAADLLTFNFTGVTAGLYDMYIRTTRENPASQRYQVNAAAIVDTIFPSTANGWSELKIPSVSLTAGANTLKVMKGDGWFHVDSARIAPAGGTVVVVAPPAPPAAGGGEGYPFASRRIAIPAPRINPTNVTQAAMDQTIRTCYTAWKNALVVPANQIVAGGYVVKFGAGITYVSEGLGMGLIIACAMAGFDAQSKAICDGLILVGKARPAYGIAGAVGAAIGNNLLNWKCGPNGEADGNSGGGDGWAATDGDLDFTFGLLMCHRQFGSNGAINYRGEALLRIAALKAWFYYPDGRGNTRPRENVMRTSDVMPQHFQAFYDASGDTFWLTVKETNLLKLEQFVAASSPTYAIIPDALVNTQLNPPQIQTDYSGGSPLDDTNTVHHMAYNACRNPWRLGTGYLYEKNVGQRARMKVLMDKITNFFKADTAGFPERSSTGYAINGTIPASFFRPYQSGWYPSAMIGPQLCAAMVDPAHQQYLNALWAFNRDYFDASYFNAELQLIPMLVASNNFWMPTDVPV